jgi:hypothetical protein
VEPRSGAGAEQEEQGLPLMHQSTLQYLAGHALAYFHHRHGCAPLMLRTLCEAHMLDVVCSGHSTHCFSPLPLCRGLEGNPTEFYRKPGSGLSYGAGVKVREGERERVESV